MLIPIFSVVKIFHNVAGFLLPPLLLQKCVIAARNGRRNACCRRRSAKTRRSAVKCHGFLKHTLSFCIFILKIKQLLLTLQPEIKIQEKLKQ